MFSAGLAAAGARAPFDRRLPHATFAGPYRAGAGLGGFAGMGRLTGPVLKPLSRAAFAVALAACCSGSVLFSSPVSAQGAVKSTHGDWQMRCEVPPGAKTEQCALVQNVAAEDRPNLTLLVIVLKTADQKSRLLRVVAPLGVLLPSGLGLKIDDKDIGRAGFVRCLTTGCVAEVVMDDALLGQLKGGKSATFIVFQTPEEGVGIPVSLSGFGPGVEALP
jgi:invasion protein IalB